MAQSPWTAVISQDDGWWIGWIAEVPGVNAQERTREKLLDTLADVLREALEMNRQDALAHAQTPHEKVTAASAARCGCRLSAVHGAATPRSRQIFFARALDNCVARHRRALPADLVDPPFVLRPRPQLMATAPPQVFD